MLSEVKRSNKVTKMARTRLALTPDVFCICPVLPSQLSSSLHIGSLVRHAPQPPPAYLPAPSLPPCHIQCCHPVNRVNKYNLQDLPSLRSGSLVVIYHLSFQPSADSSFRFCRNIQVEISIQARTVLLHDINDGHCIVREYR
jgi:hypothetical protein